MACLDENTIGAFAEGRCDAEKSERVDIHIAGCADCRRLVAAALDLETRGSATGATMLEGSRPVPRRAVARGTIGDRYTLLGIAGRGGMGEVYAAYDAKMDRKVALKLLHEQAGGGDGRGQARLLREARALARLSHPNVVTVHDAGAVRGRVFIAMEYIDGVTLREWLTQETRELVDVLAVFIQAARGLAAAHAVGLVHRDFKPGNVMVARNGAVRVTDFGLARHLGDEPGPGRSESGGVPAPRPTENDATAMLTLTATGELLGTPRFMAPEQFRATATDARTDQFGFCVALYDALYGAPPFGDGGLRELMPEVLAGRVRAAPVKSTVPTWLRGVLLRGLSVEPAARWSSMDALIAALTRDPARARRRWVLVATVILVVGLSTATLVRDAQRPATLCRGGPARLAGTWESAEGPHPRRDATEKAFLDSGAPAAREVWVRIAPALDRYAARWLEMYRESCEATHVHAAQPPALLDLRMNCLDERRTALAALTRALVVADRGVVAKAVDAVNALPSLDRCSDLKLLQSAVAPPRDEATMRRVAELRSRAAGTKVLNDTGHHLEAAHQASKLVDEARKVGYQPLLAEILAIFEQTQREQITPDTAATCEEALWTAVSTGRDDIAAEMASMLIYYAGAFMARPADARRWSSLTRALHDRLGRGDDINRAWLLHNEGNVLSRSDPVAALASYRAAAAIKERLLPADHPDIANSLNSMAEELHRLGSDTDAFALNERAHAGYVRAYGSGSIEAAVVLGNRGEYLVDLGRMEEAIPLLRDAIERWEGEMGPDVSRLGYPLTALGRALSSVGRTDQAIRVLTRALRLREDRQPVLVAETRFALARAMWEDTAQRARARALATQSRDDYAGTSDDVHATAVTTWLAAHAAPLTRRPSRPETAP